MNCCLFYGPPSKGDNICKFYLYGYMLFYSFVSFFFLNFLFSIFQVLLLLNYNEQEWWGCVLQTPKRPPLSKSLSTGSLDNLEDNQDANKSCPSDIVKKAAMVVFCDFVVGMGITWVITSIKCQMRWGVGERGLCRICQGQSQMRRDLGKFVCWGKKCTHSKIRANL